MKKQFLGLFLLAAIPVLLSAQNVVQDASIRQGKLKNGLTYYIRHNDKEAGLADFYIAQRVGSILEEPRQRGLLLGTHGFQWYQALPWQGQETRHRALVRDHRREVWCQPQCLYLCRSDGISYRFRSYQT